MPPALLRRRQTPWRFVAAVLAGHALALWLLGSPAVGTRHRPAAAAPRMTVVVRLPAAPPPEAPRPATEPRLAPDRTTPPRARKDAARPLAPLAITPPPAERPVEAAAPSPAATARQDTDATAPTPRGAATDDGRGAPSSPLRLDLPAAARAATGSSPARQAVELQAGGQPRLTAEARLARRLETAWTEENIGDGRIRLRRGDDCVILKETTASQLDPWNKRGPAPRGASPCP